MDKSIYYLMGDQLHSMKFHLIGKDEPETVKTLDKVLKEQCLGEWPEPYNNYKIGFVKKNASTEHWCPPEKSLKAVDRTQNIYHVVSCPECGRTKIVTDTDFTCGCKASEGKTYPTGRYCLFHSSVEIEAKEILPRLSMQHNGNKGK